MSIKKTIMLWKRSLSRSLCTMYMCGNFTDETRRKWWLVHDADVHNVHLHVRVWNATGTTHAILFSYFESAIHTFVGFCTSKHVKLWIIFETLETPGLSRTTRINFQYFRPMLLSRALKNRKKFPGLSSTFQEAWQPWVLQLGGITEVAPIKQKQESSANCLSTIDGPLYC